MSEQDTWELLFIDGELTLDELRSLMAGWS